MEVSKSVILSLVLTSNGTGAMIPRARERVMVTLKKGFPSVQHPSDIGS